MRLDQFISEKNNITRSQAQLFLKKELILVNWKTIKKSWFEINWDENIEIKDFPKQVFTAIPNKIPLDIIYENNDFLVINKDQWCQVYPWDEKNYSSTLLSWLRYYFLDKNEQILIENIWFVHRLDKDTSWLILIAKNKNTLSYFQKQFHDRKVKKVYLALVYWKLNSPWQINSPIWRSQIDRKKMSISKDWKNADTLFDIINYFPDINATLIKIEIKTWRTHQIRVHLSSIWFPIIWDNLYGNKIENDNIAKKVDTKYQLLHATYLKLTWQNWQVMTFVAIPKNKIINELVKVDSLFF